MAAIGILGGTFDPVHYGHLRLAEEACIRLGLERVLWLPAGQPAHRAAPSASAAHRLAMVRLAIAANPRFALDDAEALAPQPSYTVPTLERLRRAHGLAQPLVLLMGADAYAGLETWQRWRELFGLAHLGLASRGGQKLEADALAAPLTDELRRRLLADDEARDGLAAAPAGRIARFDLTRLDIAATDIRATLAAGASPRYLLPDPVLDYIDRHQLYN